MAGKLERGRSTTCQDFPRELLELVDARVVEVDRRVAAVLSGRDCTRKKDLQKSARRDTLAGAAASGPRALMLVQGAPQSPMLQPRRC